MKWKKNILTILSIFFILSLMLVSFGYAVNTTVNDIDSNSNGLAESPWPRWRGNNQGTGLSPYNTSFVDGMEKWNITLDGEITSSPVIGPDATIYICTNNTIHAIKNKKEIWSASLASDIRSKTTPAIAKDGTLYITTMNNNLTAINSDGEVRWSYHNRFNTYLQTTPVIGDDGTIYVTDCQLVFAFDPNGTLKWNNGRSSADVPIMGNSPVIGYDENIYFGSEDYYLEPIFHSISKTGEYNWGYHDISQYDEENDDISSSSAVAKDGTIYFGSADGLYAMRSDGNVKWTFQPTDNVMLTSPAIDMDGNIYTGDSKGNLYSVSPDGEKRWNYTVITDTFSSPVIGSDGCIYFADDNSTLHALNNNGKEIWNFSTDHNIGGFSPAINSDGTLYYASGNKLYALGPSSPTVDITSPSSGESMKTKSFKLEWESTTIGSDIDHFKVRLDGDDFQNVGSVDEFELTDVSVGDHTAEVKAVAESNNYAMDSIEFTVEEDTTPPTADAGEDRTVKVDEEIAFDASGSSDNREITSYEWDFDDGTTDTGETVTHK
ncbi:MAG: PQQ-binding-like beta-propeller repeat protein, partial [Thermoplasmata archaeon]